MNIFFVGILLILTYKSSLTGQKVKVVYAVLLSSSSKFTENLHCNFHACNDPNFPCSFLRNILFSTRRNGESKINFVRRFPGNLGVNFNSGILSSFKFHASYDRITASFTETHLLLKPRHFPKLENRESRFWGRRSL